MSTIKIYRDEIANSIFIQDSNGGQFINSLTATFLGNLITVSDTSRSIEIISSVLFSDFIDENNNPYGATALDVSIALNSVFNSTTPLSMEVFFAELSASFASSTSYQDVNFALATRKDNSFTHVSGAAEITLTAGDYEVHYGVLGDQSTSNNRVESQIRLLLDNIEYGFDANYSQRNNAIDSGGVNSFFLLTNVTNSQVLKLQTRHAGAANAIISARIYIKKIY